jgi:hypothetical protein
VATTSVHNVTSGSRRGRVAGAAAAITAAAAVVTAALFAASSSGAPSAVAVVTSALSKSAADKYSFSLDSTTQLGKRLISQVLVSGMFDPGRDLGAELLTTSYRRHPVTAHIRFVGDYVYTSVAPGSGLGTIRTLWDKAPVPPPSSGYGFVSDQPVSPADLTRLLQYAPAVREAGPTAGAGWTGTSYSFTARISRASVAGIVCIDRQGQVRREVTTATLAHGFAMHWDLAINDSATHETVTGPPANQVTYTKSPYWGWYF